MNGIRRGKNFWGLLGAAERTALEAQARPHVYPSGVTLCMQGEPSTHLFILIAGWVKVSSVTDDGQEMLLALRGAGEIVGELASEVTGYRTATVRAAGMVRTLIISSDSFEAYLGAHQGAARAYRRAMAERRHAADEDQRNRSRTSGAQRLARLLLEVAELHAADIAHDQDALPLSQEELASLIGVSRATVTRALSNWRSRGIVHTHQRQVTVLHRTALERIAGR